MNPPQTGPPRSWCHRAHRFRCAHGTTSSPTCKAPGGLTRSGTVKKPGRVVERQVRARAGSAPVMRAARVEARSSAPRARAPSRNHTQPGCPPEPEPSSGRRGCLAGGTAARCCERARARPGSRPGRPEGASGSASPRPTWRPRLIAGIPGSISAGRTVPGFELLIGRPPSDRVATGRRRLSPVRHTGSSRAETLRNPGFPHRPAGSLRQGCAAGSFRTPDPSPPLPTWTPCGRPSPQLVEVPADRTAQPTRRRDRPGPIQATPGTARQPEQAGGLVGRHSDRRQGRRQGARVRGRGWPAPPQAGHAGAAAPRRDFLRPGAQCRCVADVESCTSPTKERARFHFTCPCAAQAAATWSARSNSATSSSGASVSLCARR